MTLTTPQDTVFVFAAWVLRVNAAAHWSLSDKAAGVVCMGPYGFHSTQASPFQWAVVELMWDMLRQSRPLGFGLSDVRCDALLWNSRGQPDLKDFYNSLIIPPTFSRALGCVKAIGDHWMSALNTGNRPVGPMVQIVYLYLLADTTTGSKILNIRNHRPGVWLKMDNQRNITNINHQRHCFFRKIGLDNLDGTSHHIATINVMTCDNWTSAASC